MAVGVSHGLLLGASHMSAARVGGHRLPVTAASMSQDRSHARSVVLSTQGIVATSHVPASQAGALILARGGTAADAAIAANAVLGVTEPMMNGLGGDLFALCWNARNGTLHGLNASGWAPGALEPRRFTARGLRSIPVRGIDSVTVPGVVDGWSKLHQKL